MNSEHFDNAILIQARELRGLTQQQVADAVKVDRQTIYRAEQGKNASYELLCSLCVYYQVPMPKLLRPVLAPANA